MLTFEKRASGYRVVVKDGDYERSVVGALTTEAPVSHLPTERDPHGATTWDPLPEAECSMHSAMGAIPLPYLQEIIEFVAKSQPVAMAAAEDLKRKKLEYEEALNKAKA